MINSVNKFIDDNNFLPSMDDIRNFLDYLNSFSIYKNQHFIFDILHIIFNLKEEIKKTIDLNSKF